MRVHITVLIRQLAEVAPLRLEFALGHKEALNVTDLTTFLYGRLCGPATALLVKNMIAQQLSSGVKDNPAGNPQP